MARIRNRMNPDLFIFLLFLFTSIKVRETMRHTREKSHQKKTMPDRPMNDDCAFNESDIDLQIPCPPEMNITNECICSTGSKRCHTIIRWEDKDRKNLHISSYFLTLFEDEDDEDTKVCHRLPPSQKAYNFSAETVFPHTAFTEFAIDIVSLPMNPHCSSIHSFVKKCPEKNRILHGLEKKHEVCFKDRYVFTCKYAAYPEPTNSDVTWTFSPSAINGTRKDFKSSEDVAMYENGICITKSKGKTSLVINSVLNEHVGTYICHINNPIGHQYSTKSQGRLHLKLFNNITSNCDFSKSKDENDIWYVVFLAAGIVVLAAGLALYFIGGMRRKRISSHSLKHTAYISHCALTARQKQKLLKFSCWLESQLPGLNVIIDLTKKTEINKVGGLSQWIPEQILNVDKVIVLLSQEYLDILNKSSHDVKYDTMRSQTLKVLSEYRYIEQMLHENHQVSQKLIICWESGHLSHLPPIFQGRSYYLLPKFTKKSVLKDNAFLNILSAVTTNSSATSQSADPSHIV